MDSILSSIKKHIGFTEDYEHFNDVLIDHINTEFMVLNQLGVGPKEGFKINRDLAVWSDFISDSKELEGVKQYIYMRVKAIFDPYTSSVASDAHKRKSEELEWRLNVAAETGTVNEEVLE